MTIAAPAPLPAPTLPPVPAQVSRPPLSRCRRPSRPPRRSPRSSRCSIPAAGGGGWRPYREEAGNRNRRRNRRRRRRRTRARAAGHAAQHGEGPPMRAGNSAAVSFYEESPAPVRRPGDRGGPADHGPLRSAPARWDELGPRTAAGLFNGRAWHQTHADPDAAAWHGVAPRLGRRRGTAVAAHGGADEPLRPGPHPPHARPVPPVRLDAARRPSAHGRGVGQDHA